MKIYRILIVAAVLGLGAWFLVPRAAGPERPFGAFVNTAKTFNGRVNCGPANTVTIMSANPSRMYAAFIVASSTAVSICPGASCTNQQGVYLNSGGSWEILEGENLYSGAITCSASASSSVAYIEY